MPRPWISRTSVKPRAWAAIRYSSTTERMSRGWKECRSSESSIGRCTGSSASGSGPILDPRRDHVIALRLDVAAHLFLEVDHRVGAGQAGLLAQLGLGVVEAGLEPGAPLEMHVQARDLHERAGGRGARED